MVTVFALRKMNGAADQASLNLSSPALETLHRRDALTQAHVLTAEADETDPELQEGTEARDPDRGRAGDARIEATATRRTIDAARTAARASETG